MSSYIQGHDFTSSTFQEGQVTDNTSLEEASKYIGQIRTAEGSTASIDAKNNVQKINYISIMMLLCMILTIIIIIIPLLKKEET